MELMGFPLFARSPPGPRIVFRSIRVQVSSFAFWLSDIDMVHPVLLKCLSLFASKVSIHLPSVLAGPAQPEPSVRAQLRDVDGRQRPAWLPAPADEISYAAFLFCAAPCFFNAGTQSSGFIPLCFCQPAPSRSAFCTARRGAALTTEAGPARRATRSPSPATSTAALRRSSTSARSSSSRPR